MIKLKGTTLYPPALNDVLEGTPYVGGYVVVVGDSDAGTDDVLVKVAVKGSTEFDVVKDLKDRFRSRIRVAPRVEVIDAETMRQINFPNMARKPVKFIDERKK